MPFTPRKRRKRRITITGCCPDLNPAWRHYIEANRRVVKLKDAGIGPATGIGVRYYRNAVRQLARARLNWTHLRIRAAACKLIVATVPYKRPARTNVVRQAIREGITE